MRISIAAKYFGILLVLFSKNIVTSAIYVPCGNELGVGLVDPDSFGDPKEEECRKCKVEGCLGCTWDYRECTMCPVQRGLNGQKTKCVRCKNSSSCGSCQEDYRKCDYKISKCTRSVRKTKAAGSVKKLSWKAFKKDVYQNRDKCEGEKMFHDIDPAYQGLGVPVLDKSGNCVNCDDYFRFESKPRPSTISKDFCYYDKMAKEVASKAFSKSSKCKYPQDVRFKLQNTCLYSVYSAGVHNAIFDYEVKYCGKKKNVIVGLDYNRNVDGIDNRMEWFYATR